MPRRLGKQQGFSLIEMIVVLILVGVLAAMAGMGIVAVVEGYVFSRLNAATVQKGQIAIAKIVKEFNNISSVTAASSSSITFTAYRAGVAYTHTITFTGNTVTYDGDVVTDQVNSFDLGYYDTYNGTKAATWTATRKVIQITISLAGAGGFVSQFQERVTPRNL